jgi:hypothetical protein
MKIGKVGFQYATATEPGRLIFGILMLIHWVLSWFVMSVVVFFRRDFGERYLSWINIIFGVTAVGLFTGLGNWLLSSSGHMSKIIEIAYDLVVILSVYHRVIIWRKNKTGTLWHSYNPGRSWIQIPGLSQEAVAKWIEPCLLFALAYVASIYHDQPLRLWLFIGGFALLVHEQVSFYMQRQRILDMRDARIESMMWSHVMAGKPVQQTAGYAIAKSNIEIINQMAGHDAFQELPEDVASILDKEVA